MRAVRAPNCSTSVTSWFTWQETAATWPASPLGASFYRVNSSVCLTPPKWAGVDVADCMPQLKARGPPLREWDRCSSDTPATELSFPVEETNSFVLLSAVQNTARTRQLSVITECENSKWKNSEVSRTGQQTDNLNIGSISVISAFLKLWSADHKWSSGSALVVFLDWKLVKKRQKK